MNTELTKRIATNTNYIEKKRKMEKNKKIKWNAHQTTELELHKCSNDRKKTALNFGWS